MGREGLRPGVLKGTGDAVAEPQVYWVEMWRELSLRLRQSTTGPDPWRERASSFDTAVKRHRKEGPDPLVEALVKKLRGTDTVLDIGAGTGRWAIPLAGVVARVTAIDPSSAMLSILDENAAAAGVTNITVVSGNWEDFEVDHHNVVLCSHAMYSSPDLVGFVRKMERAARRLCVLVMRVPSHNGIMGELSQRVYGQCHDSPNFVIAYNILLGMGIYPNVLMENQVRLWIDDTLEGALARAKRHLRLEESRNHDHTIREMLRQSLTPAEGRWVWPDGMRSAMVWWSPTKA
ncbi:class I SAM-dependent methyltransferase [Chloroflexota bacterium]